MKKIAVVLGAFVLFVVFSGTSFAASLGASGCGVGHLIFPGKNDRVSQILSATTNGTLGNQTFGITTGTLDCNTTGLVIASRETEVYAQNNFDSIAKEMAVGTGEHLTTLASLMGYDASQFASFGKAHYGQIFASENTSATDMLVALKVGLES
jgi:hypothetical protein